MRILKGCIRIPTGQHLVSPGWGHFLCLLQSPALPREFHIQWLNVTGHRLSGMQCCSPVTWLTSFPYVTFLCPVLCIYVCTLEVSGLEQMCFIFDTKDFSVLKIYLFFSCNFFKDRFQFLLLLLSLSLLWTLLIYLDPLVNRLVHLCACICGGQKRAANPYKLELCLWDGHLVMSVLGSELWSSWLFSKHSETIKQLQPLQVSIKTAYSELTGSWQHGLSLFPGSS